MHISTPLLTTTLALGAHVTALGINCRGSSQCGSMGSTNLDRLIDAVNTNGYPDNKIWYQGEQIACVWSTGAAFGRLCAFTQGVDQLEQWKARQLLSFLKDHNCGGCGSVPRNYPNDNNVNSAGMLTANFVAGQV